MHRNTVQLDQGEIQKINDTKGNEWTGDSYSLHKNIFSFPSIVLASQYCVLERKKRNHDISYSPIGGNGELLC